MSSSCIRPLELFGDKAASLRVAHKIRSDRFQSSCCGVMVGREDTTCPHCGADLR